MGNNDFMRIYDDLHKVAETVAQMLKDEIEEELKKANEEFGEYQSSYMSLKFSEFVSTFYNAYTPKKYKRRGGLYDVLDLKTDEYGRVLFEDKSPYDSLYSEDKTYKDRDGFDRESLYETIFIEGYHGGAKYDYKKGRHPNPGTPYYRSGPHFCRWGKRAKKTKSVYAMMNEWVSEADAGEIHDAFAQIIKKHVDDATNRVVEQIPDIKRRIMG